MIDKFGILRNYGFIQIDSMDVIRENDNCQVTLWGYITELGEYKDWILNGNHDMSF